MTHAAELLEQLPASHVLELPRPRSPRDGAGADVGRRQRLAGIVSAYHGGQGLLFGWHRPGVGRLVEVFAAGGVVGEPDPHGRTPMSFPPGAVGRPYPAGGLAAALRAVPAWTRLAGLVDGLLTDDATLRDEDVRPSLDECLLHVWHAGFAWFVLAEPVPAAEIATIAGQVAHEERQAQSRAQSPEHAVIAARLQRRHREFQQGRSTGMWRVHLLAGGASPAAAASVAGLLCASADLSRHPYALAPTGVIGDLDKILSLDQVPDSPVLAGSALLASLAVTPVEEVPGLRLAMRSEFDVTPEATALGPGSVALGVVLDRTQTPAGPLELSRDSLNRHTFVCGATGAGKSQTVRHLLEGATAQGLPWLVVEPAKAEYRQMADRIGTENVIAIRPGDPATPPAGFNPLQPADGFPLQTHLDLTRALFLAAFEADEPFPQVLAAALTRCYEELGWDLALGEPRAPGHRPRYPTLSDLQRMAEVVVDHIGYGEEITANVRGFIKVRLASLRLGTTGRFFEGGHPLNVAELLRRNVVFEIEDLGDDQDKAFLMGGLLLQFAEHLRVQTRRYPDLLTLGLRHLSVFEEAHRLLRRTDQPGPAAHAVELFASLLAEVRAYGAGLVIAEQIPSKLIADAIKNTAVKIMHRLPAADDREAVGATANLTEHQSQYLVTLHPGTAAVFTDGMDQPVLVRMPNGTTRERGGGTPTAPADPIIGRRSQTCGTACAASPCTLRTIRTAQHLIEDNRWLALWAETSVVAHLIYKPCPTVWNEHTAYLSSLEPRLRDCVLSQAVDAAVAARSATLGTAIDPFELASHVVAHLTSGECEPEEQRYIAPAYRCAPVLDALLTQPQDASADPRAEQWSRQIGRVLTGDTIGKQADEVRFWMAIDLTDEQVRRSVLLGNQIPSAIEQAVGATWTAPNWANNLAIAVTEAFDRDNRNEWIQEVLAAHPPAPETQSRESGYD